MHNILYDHVQTLAQLREIYLEAKIKSAAQTLNP